MKHLAGILLLLLISFSTSFAQDDYKLLNTKEEGRKLIRLEVLVPQKMVKLDYNKLAEKISAGLETKHKTTVVRFFLDGTGPNPFCAAIMTLGKVPTMRVIGLPLEREAPFLDESKEHEGATLKGRWLDEHQSIFVWWHEQDGEMSIDMRKTLIKSAKTSTSKLVTVTIGDEVRYMMRDADPHLRPYYLILEDGALGYHEHEKLVRIFPIR